ncbi:MAPK/MAK/MRK overlapping kinase isoform X3 [Melopsittacus undulatus]|uniref:MAPK/MAK/MRK overlapping kinase isoform X3 n=1 Tax=Melopsittacus undulatus TaxID=13146 RepID=UPI00146E02F3|nr:MAPK/MAK/MRK overlapping kinase isoform X3 [Melopsittacus undulatus]XP_033918085.1 MAPK/MAK/MRK overlapping kinase isoform X3 [Melopsittacus undulatus]
MSPLEHSSAGTEACIHRSLYKQRAQLHRPKAARPAGGGEEPLHTSTEHAKAEVPRQGSRARQLPSTEQRRCIHPAAQFPASFLDLVSWTKFQKSTMLQAFWLTKLSTSSSRHLKHKKIRLLGNTSGQVLLCLWHISMASQKTGGFYTVCHIWCFTVEKYYEELCL